MRPDLSQLSRYVDGLLTDTGELKYVTGEELDPNTGEYVKTYGTRYAGPLLVLPQTAYATTEAGQQSITTTEHDVWLPLDADVVTGDELTVTSCYYDPMLTGWPLGITFVVLDGLQVARRCLAKRRA